MFEFANHILDDLHPILNHFPIAFLVASFFLVFAKRRWTALAHTEWLLFAWGAMLTLPASITGLVAHEAYEETSVHGTIETHGLPANLGTVVMLVMVVWRWRSRRQGLENDVGERTWYPIFALVGLLWIFVVGGTGGSLTYDYGINVRGVNPLK